MRSLWQNPIIPLLLVIIVIAFLIYRQLRPRKISRHSLIIFPIIIFYFILQSLPAFHPSPAKLVDLVISAIVSTILGLLACRQLHVYKGQSGKAMAKGNWTYFLWWLAAFIIKVVIAIILGETKTQNISQVEILLPVFILLVTRNAYLYWKVNKLQLILH